MSHDGMTHLADTFVDLNRRLGTEGREHALGRLVRLATEVVPGCRWAAVTAWPHQRRPHSIACSDDIAATADELQYEKGEGPCLDAAVEAEVVTVPRLDVERRWPKFTTAMLEHTPIRGVLSFSLVDEPVRSALNLYTERDAAFDNDAVNAGTLFAAHARVLMIHAVATELTSHLSDALSTSRRIGTAIGILMNVHKITAEEAFDLLRATSKQMQRKLRDIADDVTVTGTLPNHP